jgi:hypothetical protein
MEAKCDDGLLDICVVRRRSMLGRIVVFLDFLFYREQRRQWVSYERCKTLEVRTRKPIAIQVDGDPSGYTPARFSVASRALKVIIPRQAPPGLFSEEQRVARSGQKLFQSIMSHDCSTPEVKGDIHDHNGETNQA